MRSAPLAGGDRLSAIQHALTDALRQTVPPVDAPRLDVRQLDSGDIVIGVSAPTLPLEVLCDRLIELPRKELLNAAGAHDVSVTFEVIDSAGPPGHGPPSTPSPTTSTPTESEHHA